MGITATIQELPEGKKVILIAVSVGTEYYKPECFDALVDALLLNVGSGLISPDTPCIVLRGCLVQRHTLEFKFDLTPEQALSLAIYNGEEWQNQCKVSLEKLKSTFKKNFTMINWGDTFPSADKPVQENNEIYSQNQNFIVKRSQGTIEVLGKMLPKFELLLTDSYKLLLENFNRKITDPQNEDLAGLVQAAVESYCNSYVSSRMKNNMNLVVKPTQLDNFKAQSRKYVPEDVLMLNQTIELILEKYKGSDSLDDELSICFTYPFPHGNVSENATMHVLTNRNVMKPEVNYYLVFPKLFINLGYPVPSAEERKQAKQEKKNQRERIKANAVRKVALNTLPNNIPSEPEPISCASSAASSGTTSPQSVRSGSTTPTESAATSPVGSPPKASSLEAVMTALKTPGSDEKSSTVIPEKDTAPVSPAPAVQINSASRSVHPETNTIPSNIGNYSMLFLLNANNKGEANNSASSLNDEQLFKLMTDLAQKSLPALEAFSVTFPGCDEKMIQKMAVMFTIQQQAAIRAASIPQTVLQKKDESPTPPPAPLRA